MWAAGLALGWLLLLLSAHSPCRGWSLDAISDAIIYYTAYAVDTGSLYLLPRTYTGGPPARHDIFYTVRGRAS